MGAWGPAIFSDDLACDIRTDYRELLEDGVAGEEAVKSRQVVYDAWSFVGQALMARGLGTSSVSVSGSVAVRHRVSRSSPR